MITTSIASDNFRHDDRPLSYVFNWCRQSGCGSVEINTVNGEDFFEGLGFSPAASLNVDGLALRAELESFGLSVSQLDCHYALHRWQSIPYMIRGIQFAKAIGCPYIATTDGAEVPAGMSLNEVYDRAVYHISEALSFAKTHKVGINIEPHGPLTNNTEYLLRLMRHFDDPLIGINFDTANTLIAGNDPVAMVETLYPYIRHFHVKDVSEDLRAKIGEDTGIAASEVPVGQGINAQNIEKIVQILKERGWSGAMSLETRGEHNTARSLEWFKTLL